MPTALFKCLVPVCLVLLTCAASARQFNFVRDGQTLNYHWQPPTYVANGEPQQLTLTLPEQTRLRPVQAWRPEAVKRTLYTRIFKSARQQWPEVAFELKRQGPWQIEFHMQDPKQMPVVQAWLGDEEKRQFSQLLDEQYLMLSKDPFGERGIKPDHVRIIDESSTELGDVAEALLQAAGGEQAPPRQRLEYLLAFVQDIPYDPLQSDDGMRGTGFLLPQQVLENNRGDCDSKVVLLASLWRYLQPDIPQVLLFVPEHALLGIALPIQAGDEQLNAGGQNLLLLEPTGPAELQAGQIGEVSRRYIRTGRYTSELVQPQVRNSTPSR